MDKVKTLKHLVDAILEFAITSRSPDQFEVLEKSLKSLVGHYEKDIKKGTTRENFCSCVVSHLSVPHDISTAICVYCKKPPLGIDVGLYNKLKNNKGRGKIKRIRDREKSCCSCKGIGKECEEGGAWIYCDNIPEMNDNKNYDETGEKDGCNMFVEKNKV